MTRIQSYLFVLPPNLKSTKQASPLQSVTSNPIWSILVDMPDQDGVHTVMVPVYSSGEGYGSIRSRASNHSDRLSTRTVLTFLVGSLVLVLIVALANSQRGADHPSETWPSLVEDAVDSGKTSPAVLNHELTAKHTQLSLLPPPSAFGSYDKSSGYLVNRYWEPDYLGELYLHADRRLSFKKIVSKSIPEHSFQLPSLNLTTYSDFPKRLGDAYPEQGSPESATVVGVFHGQILVHNTGKYKFFFNSTAGSGVEIQDMRNMKNKLVLATKEDGGVQGQLKVEGPQMLYVTAFFRAPPVGSDHFITLEYQGPDTGGHRLSDAPGKHWINSLEEELRMLQHSAHAVDCALGNQCGKAHEAVTLPTDPSAVNAGFGCRFKYPPWKPADSLPGLAALQKLIPNSAAYLPFLHLPSLDEMKTRIRGWRTESWNDASVPSGFVLCYCEGEINITSGGTHHFAVESHGGAALVVDDVPVLEDRNKSGGGPALEGDISLPAGFHELRLGALLCVGDACGAPPILKVSVASDGGDPVQGYWTQDGVGDLGPLEALMRKRERAATPFTPERNVYRGFDADWYAANKGHRFSAPPSSVGEDDGLQAEVAKIIKPMTDNTAQAGRYAAHGAAREVPEAVYSKPAPYSSAVVDIGGKGIPWVHREMSNDLDGDAAVIGKDYVFRPWKKTLESVSAPSLNLDYHHPEFGGGVSTPPDTFGVGKEQ